MAGTKNILNTVSILKYSLFFFIGLLFYSHSHYYAYAVDLSLPSLEGTYNYWNVFTIIQNNGKVCYLVSSPIGSTGNYTDIRKPYIMVSLFGYNKVEVSINAGFLYKLNSIVSVSIDGKQERFIYGFCLWHSKQWQVHAVGWPTATYNTEPVPCRSVYCTE